LPLITESLTRTPDKRPIIYALGRLFTRQFSPTPTGIDRLDLRYAHWLLQQKKAGRSVFYVRQVCNVMRLVSDAEAERLIGELWQKWVENNPKSINTLLRKIEGELFWFRNRILSMLKPAVDAKLIRVLNGLAKPIYLNAAHIGAQFGPVHQLLRDTTDAELLFYLHDIIPIDFPEYFSNIRGDVIHQGRVQVMAEQGARVLVNSTHTAERFITYSRSRGWPTPPTELLKIGVEDHIIEAAGLPKKPVPLSIASKLDGQPYFVTVGTIEPRKNHLLLLHIWRTMAAESLHNGKPCPKLVLIGRRGWENENIIDLLDRSPSIRENVIEVNGMSDDDLITTIQHAKALLMPSFEEGWGIPLAEAMTLGTPAICSDIPALRECGQGKATYLSSLDGFGWLHAINEVRNGIKADEPIRYIADTWVDHFSNLSKLF
tara:strand:- start:10705 stop:11997 length:1293 start_codon:yes stop_codon:yes gene_type:complete